MKKVGKVMLSILAILVLAIVVFWIGWLKAPSAEAVCENVIEIMTEEFGALGEMSIEECSEEFQKGKYQGLMPYAEEMKCYNKAESLSDLEICEAMSTGIESL